MNMAGSSTAAVIGVGVVDLLRRKDRFPRHIGWVVGEFSFGFYFRVGQSIFAVAGPRLPPGPLHIGVGADPPAPSRHSVVCVEGNWIITETCAIDLSSSMPYRPRKPSVEQLCRFAPLLARFDHADSIPQDVVAIWGDVRNAVYRTDLHAARILLQGRGVGLTPTGDDVLAGILLFSNWAYGSAHMLKEVAAQAATSDLSRSFLIWAAAGRSIQPIHALYEFEQRFETVSPDEIAAQFDRKAQAIRTIGHSSGQAILAGLGVSAAAWLAGVGPARQTEGARREPATPPVLLDVTRSNA